MKTSMLLSQPPAAKRWGRYKQPYDCVVLDLRLPDMTGFEAEELRDTSALGDMPIVVFTGKEPSPKKTLARRVGPQRRSRWSRIPWSGYWMRQHYSSTG